MKLRHRYPRDPRHPGFTLVELLVVLALMIIIISLTAAIYPGLANSQRVVRSADRVSTWLIIAKERAKRDGLPRGVRFYVTNNQVTECQYIEVPQDWVPNPLQESNTLAGSPPVHGSGARIIISQTAGTPTPTTTVYFASNIATDMTTFSARVLPGSLLVLPEFGTSFLITAIGAQIPMTVGSTPLTAIPLTLVNSPNLGKVASSPGAPTLITYKFSFRTGADTLMGEPVLQLAENTMIDVQPATGSNPPPTIGVPVMPVPTSFDILFSPTGQVMNSTGGLIALWMRDPDVLQGDPVAQFDAAGEQVLVVVYPKTGMIATQPVNRNPAAPHDYAKDGVNIGL